MKKEGIKFLDSRKNCFTDKPDIEYDKGSGTLDTRPFKSAMWNPEKGEWEKLGKILKGL